MSVTVYDRGERGQNLQNNSMAYYSSRFFLVIRLCSHRMTFMLMTLKISSIFSTVIARIMIILHTQTAVWFMSESRAVAIEQARKWTYRSFQAVLKWSQA